MGRLARYFLRRSLVALLAAAGVVLALVMLVDFVETTRDLDSVPGLTGLDMLGLTALRAPSLLEQTLPFVVLFGMIGALTALNQRSELIAARAAGVSAWKYLRPVLALAALLGALWVVGGNPLGHRALEARDALVADAGGLDGTAQAGDARAVWMREADGERRAVLRAGALEATGRTFQDVTYWLFTLDPDTGAERFDRRLDAASVTWLPGGAGGGTLQFRNVREWVGDEYGPVQSALALPTAITEADILERAAGAAPPAASVWELPDRIRQRERQGYSSTLLRMQLWRLLALPVLLVAMALIGACVSMRLARAGGTWRLVLTGAAVAFAVFFATVFVEAFGEVGRIPALVATWTVPLVALLSGAAYLAFLEDG